MTSKPHEPETDSGDRIRRCGARAKHSGNPCKRPLPDGAVRCKWHGGNAPQVLAKAERRRQQMQAEQAVKTYGLPVDVSPTEALLNEVRWTAGHVGWLRERVQQIEQAALAWGETQRVDKGLGAEVTERAAPNVWLLLYQQERKHLVEVCRVAIAAGVAEREVRLAEQQGAQLYGVFSRVLVGLGLSSEQAAMVPGLLEREIRALTAPAAVIEGRTV